MAQIIDSVVNAFKRTAQRLIRNIKSEPLRDKREQAAAQYDIHHRLEGLLRENESGKYGQKKDMEVLPKAKQTETPVPPSAIENIIAELKREESSVEAKSIRESEELVAYRTLHNIASESKVAGPATKAVDRRSIKTGKAIQAVAKIRTAEVEKTTGKKSDKVEQAEVENLQKELEAIDKAIVEHIEYSVKPESRGPEETIDELMKQLSGNEKTTAETLET